jgi:hypothetical protein
MILPLIHSFKSFFAGSAGKAGQKQSATRCFPLSVNSISFVHIEQATDPQLDDAVETLDLLLELARFVLI